MPFSIKDIPDVFTNFRKKVERESFVRPCFDLVQAIKVPAAMAEGDASLLGLRECLTFGDFLLEVNDLIVLRMNEHISTNELVEEINQLINSCKSLREIKWLRKQKKLKGYDLLIFLNICVEQSNGEEEVDIDEEQDEGYEDGTYTANVDYYNPETGYYATYTLEVEIIDNEVTVIYFPNDGYLDEDHIWPTALDSFGYASIDGENGKTYEVQIL
jgi:hypothetical protein